MTDRTQLSIGRSNFSVPKLTKRLFEIVIASGLTSLVALAVITLNQMLTGRNGWQRGYDAWFQFIKRSDILGTMLLTAAVTVAFIYWQRSRDRR
jgi:hypothetical protein